MELIRILLIGCVSLFSAKSICSEEKFEVKIFKSITKIPDYYGKIPYLKEHPEADADQYTEEKRLQLCQTGLDHVLKHRKGKRFQFTRNKELEKLEAYVFVNLSSSEDGGPSSSESDGTYYSESDSISSSGGESDDDINVRPAYQCPTFPPIYIHVDCDCKEEEPTIWVIFRDSGKPFNPKNINEYRLILLDDIREANATEILNTSTGDVIPSAFDDDEVSEEQRLQMCTRAMNIAPEIGAHFLKDVKWQTSRYYILTGDKQEVSVMDTDANSNGKTNSNEEPHWNVKNSASRIDPDDKQTATGDISTDEDDDSQGENERDTEILTGSSEDTGSSKVDNLTLTKAFACPTVPEIYINVTCLGEKGTNLWAFVKKNEIKEHPVFGIVGYEFIIANSIHKIYKKNDNRDKKWQEDNLPRSKNLTEVIKSLDIDKYRGDDDDLNASIDKLEEVGLILDQFMEKLGMKDAVIDIDELKENERLSICEKAMKTIFGDNVSVTKGKTGRSQYYRFYKNEVSYKSKDRSENSTRSRRYESEEVVKAFRCPTQPPAYIRIASQLADNIGQVIISVRDLTQEFIQSK